MPPLALPPVLFRDERFVVLDKPGGLKVHGGPGGGPSVEDWFPLLSRRRDGPWLAHRLDADTSGCLVVALRRAALLAAQAEFAAGRAEKIYWAIVSGNPAGDAGTIDAKLLKVSDGRQWRVIADPAGQAAVTDWRRLACGAGLAWLELRPRTGRTHQLRVHCACLGTPILNDAIHGAAPSGRHGHGQHSGTLMLLARSIRLALHPPLDATAPPPPQMSAMLRTIVDEVPTSWAHYNLADSQST